MINSVTNPIPIVHPSSWDHLKMEVKKQFCTETPNEITAVVPRVEVREIIRGDLTYREYI